MVYDRGDSFPFDFEPNGIPFGVKSKGKLSPRSYPIQCESKWNYSFLSVDGPFLSCPFRGPDGEEETRNQRKGATHGLIYNLISVLN